MPNCPCWSPDSGHWFQRPESYTCCSRTSFQPSEIPSSIDLWPEFGFDHLVRVKVAFVVAVLWAGPLLSCHPLMVRVLPEAPLSSKLANVPVGHLKQTSIRVTVVACTSGVIYVVIYTALRNPFCSVATVLLHKRQIISRRSSLLLCIQLRGCFFFCVGFFFDGLVILLLALMSGYIAIASNVWLYYYCSGCPGICWIKWRNQDIDDQVASR